MRLAGILGLFGLVCAEWAMFRGVTVDEWLTIHAVVLFGASFIIASWVALDGADL